MSDVGDISSQICIVTGGTSGIGKAIAFGLAKRGATVVLICRNRQKGEDVLREIQTRTQGSTADLLIADLSSRQHVRAVANEFDRKYKRLDVLINNAGAMFPRREESVDGIEMTLAINHLAPFLLTDLLLTKLKTSGAARIINVNSDAHEQGKIDFTDMQMKRHYGGGVGMRAYANAKLANLLTVYELPRRLQKYTRYRQCRASGICRDKHRKHSRRNRVMAVAQTVLEHGNALYSHAGERCGFFNSSFLLTPLCHRIGQVFRQRHSHSIQSGIL